MAPGLVATPLNELRIIASPTATTAPLEDSGSPVTAGRGAARIRLLLQTPL